MAHRQIPIGVTTPDWSGWWVDMVSWLRVTGEGWIVHHLLAKGVELLGDDGQQVQDVVETGLI